MLVVITQKATFLPSASTVLFDNNCLLLPSLHISDLLAPVFQHALIAPELDEGIDGIVDVRLRLTFRDLRHRARLYSEGGLPFLGSPSPAVLLILGAAEFPVCLRLLFTVVTEADHPLQTQQKDAAVAIAHDNNLQSNPVVCRLAPMLHSTASTVTAQVVGAHKRCNMQVRSANKDRRCLLHSCHTGC